MGSRGVKTLSGRRTNSRQPVSDGQQRISLTSLPNLPTLMGWGQLADFKAWLRARVRVDGCAAVSRAMLHVAKGSSAWLFRR